jgi:hypothetical protein
MLGEFNIPHGAGLQKKADNACDVSLTSFWWVILIKRRPEKPFQYGFPKPFL